MSLRRFIPAALSIAVAALLLAHATSQAQDTLPPPTPGPTSLPEPAEPPALPMSAPPTPAPPVPGLPLPGSPLPMPQAETPPLAAQPGDGLPLNQRMANAIAERLRLSGQLKRYRVDVAYVNGLVDLYGEVTDQAQRQEVLQLVQSLPGVAQVRDFLVVPSIGVMRAQGGPEQGPPPNVQLPIDQLRPPVGTGVPQEPMSLMPIQPGAAPNPAYNPPPMPPYAWPTYAPYNNLSRVAYPNLYPYEAWPFIGPMYPFPKVPPGWRSISLTWQDGYWWYGKNATGHDWWRVRYW